jgi:hypothetical protein
MQHGTQPTTARSEAFFGRADYVVEVVINSFIHRLPLVAESVLINVL